MSGTQFEGFHGLTLKAVKLELMKEGCIPVILAEGSYAQHLEIIAGFPLCLRKNMM